MKKRYEANYKYKIFFSIGVIFLLMSVIIYVSNFPVTTAENLILIFPVLVLYFICITPKEIILDDNKFSIRNLFRIRELPYSAIQKINISYSSKSLIWYGGDKNKAHMLCFIKLSSHPLDWTMVNNSMNDYHELCHFLEKKKGG